MTKPIRTNLPSYFETLSLQRRARAAARASKRKIWIPHSNKRQRIKNLRAACRPIGTFTDADSLSALARISSVLNDAPDLELRSLIIQYKALQDHESTGTPFHVALTYLLDKYADAQPGETII